jgi:succinoglycan biosynthesis transport protein ExoP
MSASFEQKDGWAASSDPGTPSGQEIHLAEYWRIIVKRRRLIALCVALTLIIGAVVSLLSRPTYRATATLDIEKDKASPVDVASGPVSYGFDPEFLPTQTRLMRSREVAERVVARLNLAQSPELNPARKGFAQKADPAAASGKDLIATTALRIQDLVEVVPVRGTNLVELSFVASSPKLAADVANSIADAYIDWNLESKYEVVGQASQFLSTQIEQLKGEIDRKEQQLQAYGRSKDIVSADPHANGTFQNLESLNKDYSDSVADRVAKEARYHEVQTARPDTIADTLSNGLVSQLRADQAKLERDYAEKLNLFKPEWPAMLQLKAQIDKSHQHLDSVIEETVSKARDVARSDYLTALRREESLKGVLQGQKSDAMTLNTNAVEYTNLKTEVDTKRSMLDTLLRKNAETQVTSRLRGERLSNVRVVDRALPPTYRFRPSYRQNALTSLFLGLAAGIGLAFMLEYLDRSLRTAEQVERVLRLPALGIIPAVGAESGGYGYGYGYGIRARRSKKTPETAKADKTPIELLPHEQPRSTIAEAYRAFRTSLLLSRAGGIKVIAVTSTLPSEGKTSTALNLAVVLGQLGKRVVLIDADLHKPRLHETLRISNRVGLVSILAENIAPTEAIQKTTVPGVFVVTSGPNSPNPSGLLSSDAMKKFIEFVSMNFDYVVIDTPPVSPIADALLLGNLTDGIVLTVKGGKTPRDQIIRVRDQLLRANVKILGVLINNLVESGPAYGSYYSYYGKETSTPMKPYANEPRAAAR